MGRILACRDRRIKQDWDRLQASDNFRFMTTKDVNAYRGIYESPYDAFTNYMNILGDFLKRVKDLFPDTVENDELNSLYTQITNLDKDLEVKTKEIARLRARLEKYEPKEEAAPAVEESPAPAPAPAPAKKAPAKRAAAKVAEPEEAPAKKTAGKKATSAKKAPAAKKKPAE